MVENNENEIARESRGISRRTVMRTAAWTAPVVSVAAAAPAFAAASGGTVLKATAATKIGTVSQRPASDAGPGTTITANLMASGAAVPGVAITFTTGDAWLDLGAGVAMTDASGNASLAVYPQPYASGMRPAYGAAATVVATYNDGSLTYTDTFMLSYVPNVYVVRIGDGAATLSGAAAAVFLDEFASSGSAGGPSLAMPAAASGANNPFVNSGSATSEGSLTLSPDRTHLALGGYNATPGTASIAASAVSRVVGLIDKTGSVDTQTTLGTAYSANNIRGVVNSGTTVWTSGNGGTPATGIATATVHGSAASSVSVLPGTNNRAIALFGGDLYYSTGSGTVGIYKLAGAPTTSGNTATPVVTTALDANNTSPYAFLFLDRGAGVVTLYVTDDGSSPKGGIHKYSFDGSAWSSQGTFTGNGAMRGLTGYVDPTGTVVMYATGATTGNALVKVVDSAASGAAINATGTVLVANAGTNKVFRGVAFSPDA